MTAYSQLSGIAGLGLVFAVGTTGARGRAAGAPREQALDAKQSAAPSKTVQVGHIPARRRYEGVL